MARGDTQINVRVPDELKAQLDEAAASNRRSLTAEIVSRLQTSFASPAKLSRGTEMVTEENFDKITDKLADHLAQYLVGNEEFIAKVQQLAGQVKKQSGKVR